MSAMTKSKFELTTSPTAKAVKAVFYGPEGIGKSTLASRLPSPVFIDTEGSTAHMILCRYPKPKDWSELMEMVEDAGKLKIKTLVIDTLDWADILCTRSLCKEKKWDSIEAAGYGKGYVMLGEKFAELLAKLSELADKGINVVFCAHAQLRKIEKPEETGAYDHWELKCSKKVAPLVKEWADMVLFCNYDTMIIHGNNPMEANRITGNKRVMYANHAPTFDAKNRFGLPDKLPLDYEAIRSIFEKPKKEEAPVPPAQDFEHAEPDPETEPVPDDSLPENPFLGDDVGPVFPEPKPESEWTEEDKAQLKPTELRDRYPELEALMKRDGISYSNVQWAVARKGHQPADLPVELYPVEYVDRLVKGWDKFVDYIRKNS